MRRRHLATEADTVAFGGELAQTVHAGSVEALIGDLGAGKTRIAKGLAAGLGYVGDVTSPTFTLVHEYRGGRLPLFHFDFYRLTSPEELIAVGWEEYLEAGGVCVVEWADRFPDWLPPQTRWWQLTVKPDGSREATDLSEEER